MEGFPKRLLRARTPGPAAPIVAGRPAPALSVVGVREPVPPPPPGPTPPEPVPPPPPGPIPPEPIPPEPIPPEPVPPEPIPPEPPGPPEPIPPGATATCESAGGAPRPRRLGVR
jgi:hypothetical protein